MSGSESELSDGAGCWSKQHYVSEVGVKEREKEEVSCGIVGGINSLNYSSIADRICHHNRPSSFWVLT